MYHLIGLGSNWQAEEQMKKMLSCFNLLTGKFWQSDVESTVACGEKNTPCYLNAVVLIETKLDASTIRFWCKRQELLLGRGSLASHGECEADFDLLLSWNHLEKTPCLSIILEHYYRSLAEQLIHSETLMDD